MAENSDDLADMIASMAPYALGGVLGLAGGKYAGNRIANYIKTDKFLKAWNKPAIAPSTAINNWLNPVTNLPAQQIEKEGGRSLVRLQVPDKAKELGFTDTSFHGTSNFSGKVDYPWLFHSPDPELASLYADQTQWNRHGRPPHMVPLVVNPSTYKTIDAGGKTYEYANREASKVFKANNDEYRQDVGGVKIENVYDEPRTKGLLKGPKTVYITTDPTTVRSPWAKFQDLSSRDIMAGLAGGGLLAGADSDKAEAKPMDKESLISALGKQAVNPVTDYWPTYRKMNQESVDQMTHGVGQWFGGDQSGGPIEQDTEGAKLKAFGGLANMASGAMNYVWNPAAAGIHSLVSQPVENTTGVPSEWTDFAANMHPSVMLGPLGIAKLSKGAVTPEMIAKRAADFQKMSPQDLANQFAKDRTFPGQDRIPRFEVPDTGARLMPTGPGSDEFLLKHPAVDLHSLYGIPPIKQIPTGTEGPLAFYNLHNGQIHVQFPPEPTGPLTLTDALKMSASGETEKTSRALHEMQHAIAVREGMNPGASLMASPFLGEFWDSLQKPMPQDRASLEAMGNFVNKNTNSPERRAAMDLYTRDAGEVEARNVQKRFEKNLYGDHPMNTESVPRDKQVSFRDLLSGWFDPQMAANSKQAEFEKQFRAPVPAPSGAPITLPKVGGESAAPQDAFEAQLAKYMAANPGANIVDFAGARPNIAPPKQTPPGQSYGDWSMWDSLLAAAMAGAGGTGLLMGGPQRQNVPAQ